MFRHDRALFRVLVGDAPVWAATEARVDYDGAMLHPLVGLPEEELSQRWLDAAQVAELGRPIGTYEYLLEQRRLLPPFERPHSVFCVAVNYADYAKEIGRDKPERPSFFSKSPTCLAPPACDVSLPARADNPLADYEVETAVVLARDIPFGASLDEAKGRESIAGYCLANEIAWRRLFLEDAGGFWRSKNGWRATPIGPALLPRSVADRLRVMRVGALPDLRMKTWVERLGTVQDARTSGMLHPPLALMRALLEVTELRRGDVILTGSPGGVAFSVGTGSLLSSLLGGTVARLEKSERFLRPGDRVSASGDYLGHQLATVAAFSPSRTTTAPPA
jgi:2-keto-4-pentenoate hydratase/2-oxohepta-3-ene-1,7-dioic acid hydratase in catechol pathway